MFKTTRFVGIIGAAALVVGAGMGSTLSYAQVDAQSSAAQTNRQNSEGNGKTDYEREVKPGTMSERMYRRLEDVHELIGEEEYGEAEDKAQDLVGAASSDYEEAVAVQTYGHILAAQEKYGPAIQQFQRAVELNALPNPTHYGMIYNIAQLMISNERYEEGLSRLQTYFSEVPQGDIDKNAYVLAASANAELNNYRVAIDYIETALELSDKPKESWYQLLLAMYFELKDYDTAATVLERMIKIWPDEKQYWTQLSSVYLERNKDKQALSVLELAHTKDLLDKETEWKQLAQLYLFLEVPFKGAKVLEEGLERGIIERTKDHLELLGNAWHSARELDRAVDAYGDAAKLAVNGKLDMRRAYILVDQEKWGEASNALAAALEKGGLDDEGNAYILLGMTNFEQGDMDAAEDAFRQAMQFDDSRKAAVQWLKHIEEEGKKPQTDELASR